MMHEYLTIRLLMLYPHERLVLEETKSKIESERSDLQM